MQLFPIAGSPEKETVDLFVEFAVAAGPVVGTIVRNRYVTITRNGVGDYTYAFTHSANAIIDWSINVEQSSVNIADGVEAIMKARTTGATPSANVIFRRSDSMAAADPAVGAKVVARFTVKRTQD